jgi:hypothetical protein
MKKALILLIMMFVNTGLRSVYAQTYSGYTFYSKMNTSKAYLIDMNNTIYHQWTLSGTTGYSSYLLPGGTMVRTVVNPGNQLFGAAMCGKVQKVAYDGTLLWSYVHSSATYCTHHDICPMPNGNVLMIAYEVKTAAQVSAAGCSQSITMWPEKIIEVQPTGAATGNIVWEWHVWDHLVQNVDPTKPNYYSSISDHPELLNVNYNAKKDWMHANGLHYNAQLDQIVLSSHNMNEFYIIDHSTTTAEAAGHTGGNSGKGGDFLYRWGNPMVYGCGTITNRVFNIVHDAHWIPQGYPKANHIAAFNNKGSSTNGSCVDIIYPPYDGYNYQHTANTAYTPSTYNWRHNCLGTAQDMSNSQQLPNGNTLVCIAMSGYIYEIDSNQNLVWSYSAGGSVAKAFRYSADYVNGVLTATAHATPGNICEGNSSQLSVSATGTNLTFSWTSDPAGFTSTLQNPVAWPTVTTTYTVTVYSSSDTVTSSVTVTVDSVPLTPTITQLGSSLQSSAISGNQWYLNGTAITGATNQTYSPAENGTYTVQVTGDNGCLSVVSDGFNYISSGIEDKTSLKQLTVFPNPVTTKLMIQGGFHENQEYTVTIYNALGSEVLKVTNTSQIDVSEIPDGMYVLRVNTQEQQNFSKFIVHK